MQVSSGRSFVSSRKFAELARLYESRASSRTPQSVNAKCTPPSAVTWYDGWVTTTNNLTFDARASKISPSFHAALVLIADYSRHYISDTPKLAHEESELTESYDSTTGEVGAVPSETAVEVVASDGGGNGIGGDGGDGDGGGGEEGGGDGDGEPPRQPPAEGGRPWNPWLISNLIAAAVALVTFLIWCLYLPVNKHLVPTLFGVYFVTLFLQAFFARRNWYMRMCVTCLTALIGNTQLAGIEFKAPVFWSDTAATLKIPEASDAYVYALACLAGMFAIMHFVRDWRPRREED